jgi:hypothetical protein
MGQFVILFEVCHLASVRFEPDFFPSHLSQRVPPTARKLSLGNPQVHASRHLRKTVHVLFAAAFS